MMRLEIQVVLVREFDDPRLPAERCVHEVTGLKLRDSISLEGLQQVVSGRAAELAGKAHECYHSEHVS